uniref:Uncharacterized protein n=1 Tax=Utricularia reniformis TaxID=192314 RepID=A0A1Y0B4K6_9LAMI|nr:hypothetical protein AEK19_MT2176 [Utricularia reniformis]ART32323.1 hypothetical protein AEK19_MT2176 [Utricularia reniformis]
MLTRFRGISVSRKTSIESRYRTFWRRLEPRFFFRRPTRPGVSQSRFALKRGRSLYQYETTSVDTSCSYHS